MINKEPGGKDQHKSKYQSFVSKKENKASDIIPQWHVTKWGAWTKVTLYLMAWLYIPGTYVKTRLTVHAIIPEMPWQAQRWRQNPTDALGPAILEYATQQHTVSKTPLKILWELKTDAWGVPLSSTLCCGMATFYRYTTQTQTQKYIIAFFKKEELRSWTPW